MILLHEIEDKQMNDYKLFIDLDGVLANLIKGIRKIQTTNKQDEYDQDKYDQDSKYRSKMWKTIWKYTQEGGRLWAELEKMPDADQLWNYVKKYDHEILSASGDPRYNAEEQKREWFPKNFDNTKINIVRKSEYKAKFAASNHILIDDAKRSIEPWIKAGGIGILHTSTDKTISELKKLGL